MSLGGFVVVIRIIPVAARYLMKRNLFGYDINKKGTPQGHIKVKLLLPSFAALPLLMAYAGHTSIIIPKPLIPYVGMTVLDLGWIYKLYMGLLAVFCTNSINIHAGINGLEAGQTVVIAASILVHNVMQIGASTDPEFMQAHAFSIYLVLPLLTTVSFVFIQLVSFFSFCG
ncbi:hypothetical protein HPP92_001282 [Vanilla planifolia]|uniref:UDP-N-acetylglucosamine--dolichyl-phosphate N-acetylglucosaminephosphotransferase n=1 Tax=Vanilla planifolia TaxID=51239 RepID=A0A835RXW3_VANPL|nr:hypothetical protein HPP92_001282 [Vanilla planifolia]